MKQVFKLLSFLLLTGIATLCWSSALSFEEVLANTPEHATSEAGIYQKWAL